MIQAFLSLPKMTIHSNHHHNILKRGSMFSSIFHRSIVLPSFNPSPTPGTRKLLTDDDGLLSSLVDMVTCLQKRIQVNWTIVFPGRSYDVQLIKKEFMGKNLLALNVMWKYMEHRSFSLTEEEYVLKLDDVANTLK
ncbi:Protein of unknown function DUF3067 [Cynara cardunculus var. scolymus]|uniref:Uncharacterized protein n=1 Tax=Cynara cardunculus var. scolymus TaxID=59895 RepID=A0A103Y685_CYNCS|nr:Protein of unknown function DUF3067 [Cynara cardunculus var. scolymus]